MLRTWECSSGVCAAQVAVFWPCPSRSLPTLMIISTQGGLNLETCVLHPVQLIPEVAPAQPTFFRDRPTLTIVKTALLCIEKVGIFPLLKASIRGLKSRLDVSPRSHVYPCCPDVLYWESFKGTNQSSFQCQPWHCACLWKMTYGTEVLSTSLVLRSGACMCSCWARGSSLQVEVCACSFHHSTLPLACSTSDL